MGPILQSYLLGEFLSDEICLNLSCLRKSLFLGAHGTNDASFFLGNFSPLQFVSVECSANSLSPVPMTQKLLPHKPLPRNKTDTYLSFVIRTKIKRTYFSSTLDATATNQMRYLKKKVGCQTLRMQCYLYLGTSVVEDCFITKIKKTEKLQ